MRSADCFADLVAAFDAATKGGVAVEHYRVAECAVQARSAGRVDTGALLRPLAHLSTAAAESPKLRIDLWSDADVALPPTWPPDDWVSAEFVDGPVVRSPDDRFVGFHGPGITACLDRHDGRLVGCLRSGQPLSLWELGKPLLFFWWVWLRDRGGQMIHAALVAEEGQGILMGGPGGVGKSTTAFLCARAGLDFLGDDYVGVRATGAGSWRGHSLYNTTWFTSAHIESLPDLRGMAAAGSFGPDQKRVMSLMDVFPARLKDATDITAVALPRLGDAAGTTYKRVSGAAAILRMAPSCLLQFPISSGAQGFQALGRLTVELPAYELVLGSDQDDIPRAVRDLIRETAA